MAETREASATSPALPGRATDIRQVSAALSSRFEVLKLIGASEATALYLALDKKGTEHGSSSQKPPVILKVLRGEASRDHRQLRLFYLEAEAASRLKHSHIVKSSKATFFDGFNFMVIEHRPGVETLGETLGRKGWLEPCLVAGITCQIATALDYAHGLGVLHLNLHPDNILLDPEGHVLVANFGIEEGDELGWAQKERSRRMLSQYISPEQARGESVTRSSDLYSLGVVMFEMLTDRLPFNAENLESVTRKHITQAPLPPHLFCADVPRPLSEITLKLLEKSPSGRFQSGAALASILGKLYDTSQVAAKEIAEAPAPIIRPPDAEAVAEVAGEDTEREASLPEPALGPAPVPEESVSAESQTDERGLYETPTISAINKPVRQFYDSGSPPEAVTGAVEPLPQYAAPPLLAGRRGLWLYISLVIAAFVVAAGIIALARPNYLPNILRFQAAESPPVQEVEDNPAQSQEPPPSDTKSDPPQGAAEGGGETGAQTNAAAAPAAAAASGAQTPQVKKAVRRSKYRTRGYRAKRPRRAYRR